MLSLEDRAILDFERAWAHRAGPKDRVIEMTLGLTARAYYDHLRTLAVGDAGMGYDPLTVKRVLKLIEDPMRSELAV
jgi:Protein of unknown function (DUF3263)